MLPSFLKFIPQKRILVYALIIGVLPILYALFAQYQNRQQFFELQNKLETVQELANLKEKKQAANLATRAHFLGADHFYIDKNIETIPLLQSEKDALEKILSQQHLVENEAAKKRLDYLEHENRLHFSEGIVESYPYFHETTETLIKPIEVNVDDLLNILSKIEGVEFAQYTPGPNRPQMIITDFKIDKKKTSDYNEVFILNLKLIKREFF